MEYKVEHKIAGVVCLVVLAQCWNEAVQKCFYYVLVVAGKVLLELGLTTTGRRRRNIFWNWINLHFLPNRKSKKMHRVSNWVCGWAREKDLWQVGIWVTAFDSKCSFQNTECRKVNKMLHRRKPFSALTQRTLTDFQFLLLPWGDGIVHLFQPSHGERKKHRVV